MSKNIDKKTNIRKLLEQLFKLKKKYIRNKIKRK